MQLCRRTDHVETRSPPYVCCPQCSLAAVEIAVVEEEALARWRAVMFDANEQTDTVEGYLDWVRQGEEGAFLLASDGGEDVGAACLLPGGFSAPPVCRADVRVAPAARGRGHGDALLRAASAWAAGHAKTELQGDVREDDRRSVAWVEASRAGGISRAP